MEALFEGALDQPEESRLAWLAAQTSDDSVTRAEVERLLGAHERTGGILDRGLPSIVYDVTDHLRFALGERYRVEREIGHGGSAIVYLAHEEKHGRAVVLKVLKPEVAAAVGTQRFLREVQIAARLAHPNILGLIDSGTADDLLFYVMPYLSGETLRSRIQRTGRIALGESLTMLRDIADALNHAHNAGVVHRDLKPENIWCASGHAYVMDFGIAKIREGTDGFALVANTEQSIGTPAYMSPEQAVGDPATDHRADIYAWGLLAHEMLTGKRPTLPRAWKTPVSGQPQIPRDLNELIDASLAPEPDQRTSCMCDIRDAVDAIVARSSGHAPVAGRASRSRRTLIGGGVLAAAAAAAFMMPREEPGVPGPIAVAAFVNETSDSSLTIWGRLAGDWITQGLQEAGLASVIAWPSSAQASEIIAAEQRNGSVNLVHRMREETGAGLVVTGAYYLIGDSIHFQVQVADSRTGELYGTLPSIAAHRQGPESGIRELRTRLMGQMALWFDDRLASVPQFSRQPPTFEAYQSFDRGLELYADQRYADAAREFQRAYAADTSFLVARVYESVCRWNTSQFGALDTILVELGQRRASLSEYHQLHLASIAALLQGDRERAYAAERRAAELAPQSKAAYNAAMHALDLNRPAEALALLETLDPDRGAMRGWGSYWTALAHAKHLLGDHTGEREAARGMKSRYPDRRVAIVLEARALAAAGKVSTLDSLLEVSASLPARTYWSHGAALVAAGEEFIAHGPDSLAIRYLERAREWLAPLHAADTTYTAYREWLANSLYGLQRWTEAAAMLAPFEHDSTRRYQLRAQAKLARYRSRGGDLPATLPATPRDVGEVALFEARVFAIAGDTTRAIARLTDALRVGIDGFAWVHSTTHRDLFLLSGSERYKRLMGNNRSRSE